VGGHVINEEGESILLTISEPCDLSKAGDAQARIRIKNLLFLQQLFPNSAVIQYIIDVSFDPAQGAFPWHAQMDFQGHARPHR